MIQLLWTLICIQSFSQAGVPPSPSLQPHSLTLKQAIDAVLSRNLAYKIQVLNLESAKVAYDNAWDTMFLPGISIQLGSTSAYTLGTLPKTPGRDAGDGGLQRGYPASSAALQLGSYKLFNFWRDRLAYDIARLQYERAEAKLDEAKRTLRFQAIAAYFRAQVDQEKAEVATRSMNISQAILNLVKSRQALGKATPDDVSSSSVDYLNEKTNQELTARVSRDSKTNLNILLDSKLDEDYEFATELKYAPIKITSPKAYQIYLQNAPQLKDAKLALRTGEMSVELAEKNRLPLPTLSFSGITLAYNNAYSSSGNAVTNTDGNPGGQLNVEAVLSLNIPLLGPGGIFNNRSVEAARIARDSAEVSYSQGALNGEADIRRRVGAIEQEQLAIDNLRLAYESSQHVLDNIFKGMSSHAVNRLELRDSITQVRSNESSYLDLTYQHLTDKNSLSDLIGLDALPGDLSL